MEDTDTRPKLTLVTGSTEEGDEKGIKGKRTAKLPNGLTAKQEAFANALASGLSNSDAYRSAYAAGTMKDASIHAEASRLANNPAIAARVREILDQKGRRNSIYADRQREKQSDRIWRTIWQMVEDPMTPPAVKANLLSLSAKAAGMLTEQVKIENISADSKSIESEIIERLQKLSA